MKTQKAAMYLREVACTLQVISVETPDLGANNLSRINTAICALEAAARSLEPERGNAETRQPEFGPCEARTKPQEGGDQCVRPKGHDGPHHGIAYIWPNREVAP